MARPRPVDRLPGVLVSSRRDRAVVTGCLACRGDPKERAVNAVGRRRKQDCPVFSSCSTHLAARNAVGWMRSADADVKCRAWSVQPTESALSLRRRSSGPVSRCSVGGRLWGSCLNSANPGSALRATLTRDFVSSAALVLHSVGGVLCLLLDVVSGGRAFVLDRCRSLDRGVLH